MASGSVSYFVLFPQISVSQGHAWALICHCMSTMICWEWRTLFVSRYVNSWFPIASFWSTSRFDRIISLPYVYVELLFLSCQWFYHESWLDVSCCQILFCPFMGAQRLTFLFILSLTYFSYSFCPMSSMFSICGTYQSGIYAWVIKLCSAWQSKENGLPWANMAASVL